LHLLSSLLRLLLIVEGDLKSGMPWLKVQQKSINESKMKELDMAFHERVN
jgi:hypothetical protein